MKQCKLCEEEKPPSAFHPHRRECITCFNAQMRVRRSSPEAKARLKAYFARPEIRKRQNDARKSAAGKASYWRRAQASPSFALSFALYRALKRFPSDSPITHKELMSIFHAQKGCCALSGLEMVWQRGHLLPNSMTMDRIVPARGYTSGNVRLICHAINMFRGQMSDTEMLAMARAIVAYV